MNSMRVYYGNGILFTKIVILLINDSLQWIDGLYSDEKQSFYASTLIWQGMPPSRSSSYTASVFLTQALIP